MMKYCRHLAILALYLCLPGSALADELGYCFHFKNDNPAEAVVDLFWGGGRAMFSGLSCPDTETVVSAETRVLAVPPESHPAHAPPVIPGPMIEPHRSPTRFSVTFEASQLRSTTATTDTLMKIVTAANDPGEPHISIVAHFSNGPMTRQIAQKNADYIKAQLLQHHIAAARITASANPDATPQPPGIRLVRVDITVGD